MNLIEERGCLEECLILLGQIWILLSLSEFRTIVNLQKEDSCSRMFTSPYYRESGNLKHSEFSRLDSRKKHSETTV